MHAIGSALILGGIVAACLSAFASIPVLPNLGVWFQSEPVSAALFASASICAAGLALIAFCAPLAARHAIWHPLVIIPIIVSLWSWVAPMPLEAKALSFFGTPQLGLGGAWFMSLGIMTAGARCLLSTPSFTRHLTGFVGAIVAITLSVVVLDYLALEGWRPYNFTDYLAFHGLYIWVITACWLPPNKWFRWGGLLICAAIIFYSSNRTAYLAFVVAVFAMYVAHIFPVSIPEKVLRRFAACSIAILSIFMPLSVYLFQHAGFPDFVPHDIVDTFRSRFLLLDTAASSLVQNPALLIAGNGWGNFSELIFAHIPLGQTAAWSPAATSSNDLYFWDGLWLLHFHTHNEMAEHLISGGLPSLVLWLGYLVALLMTASKDKLPAAIGLSIGYVLISSMWFQMPGGLPLMAMAVAGLSAQPKTISNTIVYMPFKAISALPIMAFLMLASTSAISLKYSTASVKQVGRNLTSPSGNSAPLCGPETAALGSSLAQFSELMKSFATANIRTLRRGKELEDWRYARMDDFLCRADELMAQDGPLSVGVRGLTMRSDFAYAPQPLNHSAFEARLYSGWDNNMEWVLSRAPLRTDLAVPYLSWLLGKGEENRVLEISKHMLTTNAHDPVGLWFSGIVLLNEKDRRADGIQRLKRALANGLEKIMPVEPSLKTNLSGL